MAHGPWTPSSKPFTGRLFQTQCVQVCFLLLAPPGQPEAGEVTHLQMSSGWALPHNMVMQGCLIELLHPHGSAGEIFPCYSGPLDLTPVEEKRKRRKSCVAFLQADVDCSRHLPQHLPLLSAFQPFLQGGVKVKRPHMTRYFEWTVWKGWWHF